MVSTLRRRDSVDIALLTRQNSICLRIPKRWRLRCFNRNPSLPITKWPPEGGHGKGTALHLLLRGVTFRVTGVVVRLLGNRVVIFYFILEGAVRVVDPGR